MRNRSEKVYPTFEEALKRLLESSTFMHGKDNVTGESARIMLQRGAREVAALVKFSHLDEMFFQVEGGWQYTRDRRFQVTPLYGYPPDFLLEFCRNIRCPHLLIKVFLHRLLRLEGFRILRWPQTPKLHQTLPPLMFFCTGAIARMGYRGVEQGRSGGVLHQPSVRVPSSARTPSCSSQ